jgi:hypothetical protein
VARKIYQGLGILVLSVAALMAASAERWIHVRVEGAKGGSASLSLNLPVTMASAALAAIPSDTQHHEHGKFDLQASVNGVDLRAMLDAVRNSPDGVSASLERNNTHVSVAKSGSNLLIKIVANPSAEHHSGKTIAIKVPIAVVRAMLTPNSDQVDVDAGLRAIAREGDVDVTVNAEKETVHVWTDSRTQAD